jgi:chitinase
LKPDGTLMITDEWASMQKDDTGTLLGMSSDPFSSASDNQDRGIMKRLIMLKARFPHLKTAFSIGGWTLSGQFASVTADDTKRKKFIDSAIAFANKFGFDGIDIDWEYPVVGGNLDSAMPGVNYAEANPGKSTDAVNYSLFLKELRAAINANGTASNRTRTKSGKIEVSIAVGLGPKTIDAVNYADFIDYVDTVNLMAYDFNGGWTSVISHNAPLYDNKGLEGSKALSGGFDQSEWNDHDAVLNILWNLKNQRGDQDKAKLGLGRYHKGDNGTTSQLDREALLNDPSLTAYRKKLVLGIPFYGRIWSSSATLGTGNLTNAWFSGSSATMGSLENGVADTKDVIYARDNLLNNIKLNDRGSNWPAVRINAADIHWDPIACASLIKTSGHIVSFDDEDGIYHKAKYAKDKGLGGVMVWEVDGDTPDGKLSKSFIAGMTGGTAPLGKTCAHKP